MTDEFELMALISSGENDHVDFKRLLDLDSSSGKSEFVKDVIAIANSADLKGYLLIGVEDNKTISGTDEIKDERVQQILYTYITPPVKLECCNVPVKSLDLVVGVLIITPGNRPHKISRDIEKLHMDDVFVRRGSITTKASPEEIISMAKYKPDLVQQIQQYIEAGQTYDKLKDWMSSISYYTKAIELMPSAELFLYRALAYENMAENRALEFRKAYPDAFKRSKQEQLDPTSPKVFQKKSFNDYSAAITLNPSSNSSKEREVEARLGRIRVCAQLDKPFVENIDSTSEIWKIRQGDIDWLKINASGKKLGETLFLEVDEWDWAINGQVIQDALALVSEAIKLGYNGPHVYHLRARIHHYGYNLGLALSDYTTAISSYKQNDEELIKCYESRSGIYIEMDRYKEMYEDIKEYQRIRNSLSINSYDRFFDNYLVSNILVRLGKIKLENTKINSFWQVIAKLLILYKSEKDFSVSISEEPNRSDLSKFQNDEVPKEMLDAIYHLISTTKTNKA